MIDEQAATVRSDVATGEQNGLNLPTMEHIQELHQKLGQLGQQVAAPPSDWALYVGGQPMMRPIAGKEPCGFYRFTQRLFLGLDWRRVA
jgi:hypothetical protein